MYKLATIISRIFDPFVMFVVLFIILFYRSPKLPWVLFLMVVIPFMIFFIAWKTKIISDWDVRDRKERPKILWSMFGVEIVAMIVLQLWQLMPIILAFIGFAVITHFWKISGHLSTVAFVTGLIIVRFGVSWWPVLLAVPLVGWARVVRKNHSIAQVIAGTLYSWIVLLITYYVSHIS